MNYNISFAKESDYKEILLLLHKCFEKEYGFFQKLVPVLYKDGKNPYENHIIVKDGDSIIATIVVKKDVIIVDNKKYNFLILGSLGVDHNYRNQGIMGALFDFILNTYTAEVDFFVLSGIFERYKRFGFYPSSKLYQVMYPIGNSNKYSFADVFNEDINWLQDLYNKKNYRVIRNDFSDSLNEWMFKPFVIKDNDKKIGYLIYNTINNLIEEIILIDNSVINDVVGSFSLYLNKEVGLKITISNKDIHSFINENLVKIEYFEKTLYKIINEEIKEIYIPKNDMV